MICVRVTAALGGRVSGAFLAWRTALRRLGGKRLEQHAWRRARGKWGPVLLAGPWLSHHCDLGGTSEHLILTGPPAGEGEQRPGLPRPGI